MRGGFAERAGDGRDPGRDMFVLDGSPEPLTIVEAREGYGDDQFPPCGD